MHKFVCFLSLLLIVNIFNLYAQQPKNKQFEVIVDTDLGGDPDDIQSLFRLLHYSDILKIKAIVSTPCTDIESHPWDTIPRDILIKNWIKRVDLNFLRSKGYPELMTEEHVLSVVYKGSQESGLPAKDKQSRGAKKIIELAKQHSPENPVWILIWGSTTTVAQSLHDAPEIAPNIRIYSIASTNTQHDSLSRNYIYKFMQEKYPRLWWIENGVLPKWQHETFRGVYQGGIQEGEWGTTTFIGENIKGHGSYHNGLFKEKCGDVFPIANWPKNSLKEGDSPSMLYLLSPVIAGVGNVDDPTQESWGGRFRKANTEMYPNYYVDLNEPPEKCQATISKWRLQYLSHWKMRWDRYQSASKSPKNIPIASKITVFIGKHKKAPVYELFRKKDSQQSIPIYFAEIPGSDTGNIVLQCNEPIQSYAISPKRLNINAEIDKNTLRIKHPVHKKLAVTINQFPTLFLFPVKSGAETENSLPVSLPYFNVNDLGIPSNSTQLLTKSIQQAIDSIAKQQGGVLYFPCGTYPTGTIHMRENVFLFLDRNTVISGSLNPADYPVEQLQKAKALPDGVTPKTNGSLIYFRNIEHSGIIGSGAIISHGAQFRRQFLPDYRWLNTIRIINSKNIIFQDIFLLDAIAWNTHIIRSDSISFKNVKIINEIPPVGWNPEYPDGFWNNTDGINPDASRNVFIDNCFAYCGDDCITIKITNTKIGTQENALNIKVSNSMFMSATGALKIGTETLGKTISNVFFNNIDILDMKTGYCLKLTPRDKATVENIYFKNIYLEQTSGYFLECRIMEPRNKKMTSHPVIENIYFENIHLMNDTVKAMIKGLNEKHTVKNISFKNLYIKNKKITKFDNKIFITNKFLENMSVQ